MSSSKAALIEQLAELDWHRGTVIRALRFDELPAVMRQRHRDQVMRQWPLIVAFVSDWLIAVATMDNGECCVDLEAQWAEEMGQ